MFKPTNRSGSFTKLLTVAALLAPAGLAAGANPVVGSASTSCNSAYILGPGEGPTAEVFDQDAPAGTSGNSSEVISVDANADDGRAEFVAVGESIRFGLQCSLSDHSMVHGAATRFRLEIFQNGKLLATAAYSRTTGAAEMVDSDVTILTGPVRMSPGAHKLTTRVTVGADGVKRTDTGSINLKMFAPTGAGGPPQDQDQPLP